MSDMKLAICVVAIAVVFIAICIKNYFDNKKRIRRIIKESFGKADNREYAYEEMASISYYFRKCHSADAIDDITYQDLDFDSVFLLVNNTRSSIGREVLYRMLREVKTEKEELDCREKIMNYFRENEEERIRFSKVFYDLGISKRVSVFQYIESLFLLNTTGNFKNYMAIVLLIAAILFFALVDPVNGVLLIIAVSGINIVGYYREKARVELYFNSTKYILKMLKGASTLAKKECSILATDIEFFKEINREFEPIKRGAFWINSGADFNGSITDALLDYVRMLTHADLIKFNHSVKFIQNRNDRIVQLYERLGRIEAMISAASFRELMPYTCVPEFTEEKDLEITDVYHPMIDNPVTNSITTKKSVLITGSNASGKSTFLKAVAINAILSQTIHTSLTKRYRAGRYTILSSMALSDSIENGESYYMAEIKALKRITDRVAGDGYVLAFIDEVLRGTNTVERIAASTQVLKYLDRDNVTVFAATHDIELTHLLEKEYDNYHFEERVSDEDVTFDYTIREGRAQSRNAIKLLALLGYDAKIVEDAKSLAEYFVTHGEWIGKEAADT